MKKLKLNFTCGMKGYSLIELVMAMGLILIIAMVVTSILNISSKSLRKTYLNQNTSSEISYAIEYIKDEIASSDYNYSIDDKVYFVKENGNKFEYISYEFYQNAVYRNLSEATVLKKNNFKSYRGRNVLIDTVKNFYIKDTGSNFELYLEKDNNKSKIFIAKRNLSL
ncbi:prepilin-type N-terminal cleavage/methylation domain-containing protein [Peptoniphilus sp. MSJ-1]|uniref:Prepilin-type N-terminal cleavage/methylation domain-containing protein n=1 Tax=Peptoniphilus ovalis TaxID=2841503 RepID=A0ABS6FG86_9FIRM|nr:prepilin-type N-terminal cleavage/methylation domain-containing protein [Peptoniphilus ovalis]MBU5669187.1 prepilin-type N-terminal cleavage/methylation domain-containing protein [Peptoniphilus ovalis]